MADKGKKKKQKVKAPSVKRAAKARSAPVRRTVQASANKTQVAQKMAEMRRAPQPVSPKIKAERQQQMMSKAAEMKRASQNRVVPPRPERPPEQRQVVPPRAKADLQRQTNQKMQYNR